MILRFFLLLCLLAVSFSARPVIPTPTEMTSGSGKATFARCAIQFGPTAQSLLEVHASFFDSSAPCAAHGPPFAVHVQVANSSELCSNESYELHVTSAEARIFAACPSGTVRAYATLLYLFEFNEDMTEVTIDSLPIHVRDGPRFEHRGLMIDTSRHFMTKKTILQIISSMALVKLNVLHWHISDDDSFPLHSPSYPNLAPDAAFSSSMIYKKQDVLEIIAQARRYFIKIVPEIDSPSHTRALGLHEPLRKILTCFDTRRTVEIKGYGRVRGGPPEGVLDPTMNETYDVMKNLLKDVFEYFTWDTVHLGGDEVLEECWDSKKSIKKFMDDNGIKDYKELLGYYIERLRKVVKDINPSKKTIQWITPHESKVKYGEDQILQYWGNSKDLKDVYGRFPKNKVILSPNDYAYLDCGYESPYGRNCWCGEFKTWTHMYRFEPTDFGIPKENILGGEVCAWAEVMNNDNIENKLWPRSAAYAAAFWEQRRPEVPDLVKLATALNSFSHILKSRGIRTSPITGEYCERATKECFSKYP